MKSGGGIQIKIQELHEVEKVVLAFDMLFIFPPCGCKSAHGGLKGWL